MGLAVTDMGKDESKLSKNNVKKHVSMIHCSNHVTLLQRKISNALLFHAYNNLLIEDEHFITIKELCDLIGYSGNNHKVIKDSLKGLMTTLIEWNVVNDDLGGEDWTASTILASVHLQKSLCYYAYSPRMKKLLHTPSMYAKINLYIQSHFQSNYGLALYENCLRYQGLPATKWFDLEQFKKMMGIPEDTYKIYRDFKRRVLDKAIEEVNSYSNIFIVPEFQKKGRAVLRLRFSLKERERKKLLGLPNISNEEIGIMIKLETTFKFTSSAAKKLIKTYGEVNILEKIALIESSKSYQMGRIKNLAGFLSDSLSKNYQNESSDQQKISDKSIKEGNKAKALEFKYREEYRLYLNEEILSSLNNTSLTEQENLLSMFAEFLEASLYKDIYLREGMKNVLIQEQFCEFIKSHKPELIKMYLSFKEYMEDQQQEA